jgi:hypothetical protein
MELPMRLATDAINSQMTFFPWNVREEKHKYHLAN